MDGSRDLNIRIGGGRLDGDIGVVGGRGSDRGSDRGGNRDRVRVRELSSDDDERNSSGVRGDLPFDVRSEGTTDTRGYK